MSSGRTPTGEKTAFGRSRGAGVRGGARIVRGVPCAPRSSPRRSRRARRTSSPCSRAPRGARRGAPRPPARVGSRGGRAAGVRGAICESTLRGEKIETARVGEIAGSHLESAVDGRALVRLDLALHERRGVADVRDLGVVRGGGGGLARLLRRDEEFLARLLLRRAMAGPGVSARTVNASASLSAPGIARIGARARRERRRGASRVARETPRRSNPRRERVGGGRVAAARRANLARRSTRESRRTSGEDPARVGNPRAWRRAATGGAAPRGLLPCTGTLMMMGHDAREAAADMMGGWWEGTRALARANVSGVTRRLHSRGATWRFRNFANHHFSRA